MAKKTQPRQRKHIPQRTCVGCRTVLEKRAMTRIVRTPDGLFVDPSGKQPGRGAYLHNQTSCWEAGIKSGLPRAFKSSLTAEDITRLTLYLDNYIRGKDVED